MSDLVTVQNTRTGGIGQIPRTVFESSVLNPDGRLIEVDSSLYKPCGCNGQVLTEDILTEEGAH